jgi:N-acetyl-anhydromuramyl-L-alanine amidase AmpD
MNKIPKLEFRNDVLYIDGVKAAQSSTPHYGGATDLAGGLIVLHYTGDDGPTQAINWFKDPRSKVSAHFVIGQDGHITQVLKPTVVGWHAGKSEWTFKNGEYVNGVNGVSVGIEQIKKNGSPPWPMAQVISCVLLCRALKKQYGRAEIVGHDDVAPGRKVDPGDAYWDYWEKAVAEIDSQAPPAPGPTPEPEPKPTPEPTPEEDTREQEITCPHCGESVLLYVTGNAKVVRADYE